MGFFKLVCESLCIKIIAFPKKNFFKLKDNTIIIIFIISWKWFKPTKQFLPFRTYKRFDNIVSCLIFFFGSFSDSWHNFFRSMLRFSVENVVGETLLPLCQQHDSLINYRKSHFFPHHMKKKKRTITTIHRVLYMQYPLNLVYQPVDIKCTVTMLSKQNINNSRQK